MPSAVDVRRVSDDDEHDHLVLAINTKPQRHQLYPQPSHGIKRPHTSSSLLSPHYRIARSPTSPFPLSSSLPLPPPPPPSLAASASSAAEETIRLDEQFLLIHKLDRKALGLLSPAASAQAEPLSPSSSSAFSSSFPFGRLALACELLYHSLSCKQALYGDESMPVLSHVEFLVTLLNRTAITALRSLQAEHLAHLTSTSTPPSSSPSSKELRQRARQLRLTLRCQPLAWLKDAEWLCLAHPGLPHCHTQTLHHLALAYRLLHKPRTACRLLHQALHTLATTDEASPLFPRNPLTVLRCRTVLSLDLAAVLGQREEWEEAGVWARAAVDAAQQGVLGVVRREGARGEEVGVEEEEEEGEEEGGVGLGESVGLLVTAYRVLGWVEERLHAVGCVRWWERAAEVEERMEGETEEGKRDGDEVREMVERVRERVQEAERVRRKEREQLLARRGMWRVVTKRSDEEQRMDGPSRKAQRKPRMGRQQPKGGTQAQLSAGS